MTEVAQGIQLSANISRSTTMTIQAQILLFAMLEIGPGPWQVSALGLSYTAAPNSIF